MKKPSRLIYPEILVCGYPRSGTSLVTELIYGLTDMPKPNGFLYQKYDNSGYNEFVETYTMFHYLVHGIYDKNFFIERKYVDDIMWQELSQAITNFLQRKKCFVFKENHLMTTINGFKELFQDRKVVYVDRDINSVYRSVCNRQILGLEQIPFSTFLSDYSKSCNAFASSWAWRDSHKIDFNMLISDKKPVIKRLADFLEIELTAKKYDMCLGMIR